MSPDPLKICIKCGAEMRPSSEENNIPLIVKCIRCGHLDGAIGDPPAPWPGVDKEGLLPDSSEESSASDIKKRRITLKEKRKENQRQHFAAPVSVGDPETDAVIPFLYLVIITIVIIAFLWLLI